MANRIAWDANVTVNGGELQGFSFKVGRKYILTPIVNE